MDRDSSTFTMNTTFLKRPYRMSPLTQYSPRVSADFLLVSPIFTLRNSGLTF